MRTTLILAAGRGTRMGEQTLPKCLLPYRGNAILGNVIDMLYRHNEEQTFVIAIPEGDEHIMNFTASAYPGYTFTFVKVPESVTPLGPIGTTQYCLNQFKELPKNLTVTVADCIFSPVFATENIALSSVLFVAPQPDPENFLNATFKNGRHVFVEKGRPDLNGFYSWSGLSYITDVPLFKELVDHVIQQRGTGEASYADLWKEYSLRADLQLVVMPFLDLGTKEKYTREKARLGTFDYSKPDQVTYLVRSTKRVVKWFENSDDAYGFYQRGVALEEAGAHWILPREPLYYEHSHCVSYAYTEGLINQVWTAESFRTLLRELKKELWGDIGIEVTDDLDDYFMFIEKTESRTLKYLKAFDVIRSTEWPARLTDNFWSSGMPHASANIHGDLTLDNIVVHSTIMPRFTLIDWRPTIGSGKGLFGAQGNVYYDLAKLWVSITIDISKIKNNMGIGDNQPPSVVNAPELYEELSKFCMDYGLSYRWVEKYGVLLMAAMSGVHREPLATSLYNWSIDLATKLDSIGAHE